MFTSKVSIHLDNAEGGDFIDDIGAASVKFEVDMTDCSVHAWFKLFERVLKVAGFNEEMVMNGAAGLAFNEWRNPNIMKTIAGYHGLVLEEDEDVVIIRNDLEELISPKATD